MPRVRFALLALVLCAPLAHAAAPAPANLLQNPGFEEARDGFTAAWDTTSAGLPTVFFGRDTLERHGGGFSVYVANISMAVPLWHNWSQSLLVGPELWGKDLVLTVWSKSNGLAGRGYVLLQCYRDTISYYARLLDIPREEAEMRLNTPKTGDPARSLDWRRTYFSEENTGWVKREVRAHVPRRTNMVFVRLGLFGTGQVYFDDASLAAVPGRPDPPLTRGVNLLEDPSFEGDGNLWEYSVPPYGELHVERDSSVAHSGHASLRIDAARVGMMESRVGVVKCLNRLDLGGKRFRVSAWCKTDTLKGVAFLKVYCHTPDTVWVGPTAGALSGTRDWVKLGTDFVTPRGAVQLWLNAITTVPATGRVWFDDLSLEYLGPAAEPAAKPARRPPKPPPRPLSRSPGSR
jgi:hypothetical protein